ncbi:MAG TPA: cytidylate kinase-like family protein [Dongiaceae bacterium]|nr:cytidylate kinase-like family protein [Dongiaceae bacterium]
MISVITITHQPGAGGTQLASLIARKFGWKLLARDIVNRIARTADLDAAAAAHFDPEAARWSRVLRQAGINPADSSPYVAPRWLDPIHGDSVHALGTQLIQAAADAGECVIVGHGAQCLLQGQAGVFHVLAYAPLEQRIQSMQARWPELADVESLLASIDSQRADYIRQYYGRDWLDPTLYDLCLSTSVGLDRAATLVNEAVVFPATSWTPTEGEEVEV